MHSRLQGLGPGLWRGGRDEERLEIHHDPRPQLPRVCALCTVCCLSGACLCEALPHCHYCSSQPGSSGDFDCILLQI